MIKKESISINVPPDCFLSISELADIFSITIQSIYNYIKKGKFKTIKHLNTTYICSNSAIKYFRAKGYLINNVSYHDELGVDVDLTQDPFLKEIIKNSEVKG